MELQAGQEMRDEIWGAPQLGASQGIRRWVPGWAIGSIMEDPRVCTQVLLQAGEGLAEEGCVPIRVGLSEEKAVALHPP